MRKIIEIFTNDVKNISKSTIAVVIILGICFIPGIYAWLNIDSNWGPYDNTGNLPIAVVNKDKGITLLGENINIGNEMEESLKNNDAMKWTFTDEEDAKLKVEKGKYYGAIIIPEDFSNQVITIVEDGATVKPTFDFYVNDKKNPIAPIIVNKAVGTIQNSVNQAFVNKIIYKFIDTAEDLNVVDKGLETTDDIIAKLNDAKIKVQELRTIVQTTNLAADTTSKSLAATRELLPKVSDISDTTKQGINSMRNAAKSFEAISDNISNSIDGNISAIIGESETVMRDIEDTINHTNSNVTAGISNISQNIDEDISTIISDSETAIKDVVNIINTTNADNLIVNISSITEKLDKV